MSNTNYNFNEELKKQQQLINNMLSKVFKDETLLDEASNYALLNGGKRLRPILLIEFAKLFNDIDETVYEFATSLELIHNYSLVHDDLPSMDDDDYRRGNLTVHKKFGEDIAILSGDNLLNKSYEILFDGFKYSKSKEDYIKACEYLALQSGSSGMIGGQILDISNDLTNEEKIVEMYIKKTCGLIKSACKCGAILSGANDRFIDLSEEFGEALGLAFQIQDDILDYEQDLKINKKTMANISSMEIAIEKLNYYSEKSLEIIEEFPGNTRFLKELVKYLINREY